MSFGEKPGIVEVRRADYDGWPVGMALAYVGPFDNWEAYRDWAKEKNPPYGDFSGYHTSWHELVEPAEYVHGTSRSY